MERVEFDFFYLLVLLNLGKYIKIMKYLLFLIIYYFKYGVFYSSLNYIIWNNYLKIVSILKYIGDIGIFELIIILLFLFLFSRICFLKRYSVIFYSRYELFWFWF